MAIKKEFTAENIKPPTWSGNTTCPNCGSKRCAMQGGMFYENGKLETVNKRFCFDCETGENTDTRKK